MKLVILIASITIVLASCGGGSHNVKQFNNGVFEITFTGAEGEPYHDIPNKVQLLAAYKAQSDGCEFFRDYNDAQNSNRISAKMGMFAVKTTVAKLYKCAIENEPLAINTSETIEIQESRFGSLRDEK